MTATEVPRLSTAKSVYTVVVRAVDLPSVADRFFV